VATDLFTILTGRRIDDLTPSTETTHRRQDRRRNTAASVAEDVPGQRGKVMDLGSPNRPATTPTRPIRSRRLHRGRPRPAAPGTLPGCAYPDSENARNKRAWCSRHETREYGFEFAARSRTARSESPPIRLRQRSESRGRVREGEHHRRAPDSDRHPPETMLTIPCRSSPGALRSSFARDPVRFA